MRDDDPGRVMKLVLYPCQQATSFLACTRPPDFVTIRRSFSGLASEPVLILAVDCDYFQASAAANARGRTDTSSGGPHHVEMIKLQSRKH